MALGPHDRTRIGDGTVREPTAKPPIDDETLGWYVLISILIAIIVIIIGTGAIHLWRTT